MTKTIIALVFMGACGFIEGLGAQAPRGAELIVGTWSGRLEGPNLLLVFHVATTTDGKFSATIESPDQGATGVPAGEVTFADSVFRLTLPVVNGEYQGRLGQDGKITGEWRQGANRTGLVLAKGPVASRTKPQDPAPPLPYHTEDVTFRNAQAGVELAGTLTRPSQPGRYAAVVLITGSGPQDRDEALMGHRPFLVLSDHLTRQGIAVLRYDDRGVGKSGGTFAGATSEDFATDALAAVAWLKQRSDIDPSRIGLIGHSEGGLIAPLAASRSRDVAFIVMLAGPGVKGEDILYEQGRLISRASGAAETDIQRNIARQQRIFAAVKATTDTAVSNPRVREILRAAFDSMSAAERAASGLAADPTAIIDAQTREVTSPWFRWFMVHDPAPTLERVTVPVLALNGELDLQVPPQQNLPAIEAALKKANNRDVTIRMLPRLNHLFQTATTGAPAEYGRIQETMSPTALETISAWINERFGRPRN